jgi:hypothetical protein
MPPAVCAPKKTEGLQAAPLPTTELPVEPRRHQKCRSSRAEVETADRLAFPVPAGSVAGADDFSVRAGH